MSSTWVLLAVLALPLWLGVIWMRHLASEVMYDIDQEQRESVYHHMVDVGNLLSSDVHRVKILRDGKSEMSRKQATKVASATTKSGQLWELRLVLMEILDRLDRLGQALELGIFDIEIIWETNGEAILAAANRSRHLVDAIHEINRSSLSSYAVLVEELEAQRARSRVERSAQDDVPVAIGAGAGR